MEDDGGDDEAEDGGIMASLLGVVPKGLLQKLHHRGQGCELPSASWLTLSDVRIHAGDCHDRRQPLSGVCHYEFDSPEPSRIANAALRVQYFHPQPARDVAGFSHSDAVLSPPHGEFQVLVPPAGRRDNHPCSGKLDRIVYAVADRK